MSLERNQQINTRISDRNISTYPLQPNINCRPVSTKYAVFPLIDLRRHVKYPLQTYAPFNSSTNFNPSNLTAPPSGFSDNVNLESELRNQIFALQRCSQSVYVPKPSSDMYQDYMNTKATASQHQDLFTEQKWTPFNPNTFNFKTQGFNNSTRNDLKNL